MNELFVVFDSKDQVKVAKYTGHKRALNKADKLNLEYGAHRYCVYAATVFDKWTVFKFQVKPVDNDK